ncbi:hypothetical protein AJ80_04938 [Polytolypa hystricis UAMH7299]|uniref:Ketoreductase domain-containing protein n=1 Tax=Polytolypa hystricis (strain UAMH7299) TaxID=1447883 RepID=A0A2B7Y764_POLH7|nr:hypothetical protein AJ80_04938 [Polytolypa hystricis UAMH7299]
MTTPYAGKTALIIGGTHGIGLETARLLLTRGAKVLLTGRRAEPVTTAAHELSAAGFPSSSFTAIQSDITSLPAIRDLIPRVESSFGAGTSIDLLFVNAGYAVFEPTTAVTEEIFDRTFNTNTRGAFFVTQTLLPYIRPGGAIVFTTSVSIHGGFPGLSVYSASKAAVHSFAQTLAAELARYPDGKEGPGIRVNVVSPGYVDTPTMGTSRVTEEEIVEHKKYGAASTPMGRIAQPEEVARAVAFLGFEATFTSGEEVLVDGGSRLLKTMPA